MRLGFVFFCSVFTPGAVFCSPAGEVPEEPGVFSSAVFMDNTVEEVQQQVSGCLGSRPSSRHPPVLPDRFSAFNAILQPAGEGEKKKQPAKLCKQPFTSPPSLPLFPLMKRRYNNICTGIEIPACLGSNICWMGS